MDRNRGIVLAGAAVTVVTTAVLFLVPVALPLDPIRRFVYDHTGHWIFGNPLIQLRVLGGVPGGLLAGYLSRDTFGNAHLGTAMRNGLYAIGVGFGVTVAVFVGFNVIHSTLVRGVFPPPLYAIAVVPLTVTITLLPAYLFGGGLAAAVGNWVSSAHEQRS